MRSRTSNPSPKSSKLTDKDKVLRDYEKVPPKLLTPLMRQYVALKRKYPDAILLFRVGDFYETYFQDAQLFAEVAEIILTRRPLPNGYEIPMAGVPYHSVDSYLKILVERGYKVAIAEQLEDPKKAKGLVKRDVVQVITSGTILEPDFLNARAYNFLGVVTENSRGYHLLAVDFSSRRAFYSWFNDLPELLKELRSLHPSEVIYKGSRELERLISESLKESGERRVSISKRREEELPGPLESYVEDPDSLYKVEQFGGADTLKIAISYLMSLNPGIDIKLSLQVHETSKFLKLDPATMRNLEVLEVPGRGEKGSLLWALDKCVTPMGSRTLRMWLVKPVSDREELRRRTELVEGFYKDQLTLTEFREGLRGIGDLDRLTSKVRYRRGGLKEIYNIGVSLSNLAELLRSLDLSFNPSELLRKRMELLKDLVAQLHPLLEELDRALELKEEGAVDFRRGYDELLDSYRELLEGGQQWLESYQERERRRTGIKSLKVGYNQVFGYYIEVTKANLSLVPSDYIRKQTLTSAERFITKELKEFEEKFMEAQLNYQERVSQLTEKLFEEIDSYLPVIDKISREVAELDTLSTFAFLSLERGYVKPEFVRGYTLKLKRARHPSLELILENFVPNDLELDENRRFMILTGPNMGGKSTYLKTVGLVVLMAHIGSFVPADEAIIGEVDGIFSRMGSGDDILRGRSTFMVEMLEMAYILRNSTEKSLILLDEVGRGTSTYDGLALAWAISEHIAKKVRARTIFATHFYQLTTLEGSLKGVFNAHVEVAEEEESLRFLYEVKPGALLRSYGIEVAKLAGIDEEIISRAYQLLKELEITQVPKTLQLGLFSLSTGKAKRRISSPRLEQKEEVSLKRYAPLIEELKRVNPDTLRPIDALNLIYRLKELLGES